MDRADGELARISGNTSPWGHQYDYFSDVFVTALFFIGIGIGLRGTTFWNVELGLWTIVMGVCATVGVIAAEILAEKIDQAQKNTGEKSLCWFFWF